MNWILLADAVLALHFAFVLGVVLPVPLIAIGVRRGWRWVRNRRFRAIHLAMIGIVVGESLVGLLCPLTEWEHELRRRAGEPTYEGSFVQHWIGRLIYYEFEPWVFTLAYVAFGAVIVMLYVRVPPEPAPE